MSPERERCWLILASKDREVLLWFPLKGIKGAHVENVYDRYRHRLEPDDKILHIELSEQSRVSFSILRDGWIGVHVFPDPGVQIEPSREWALDCIQNHREYRIGGSQ